MATVILSRGALSIVAKEYYQKLDKAQEKLFAYIYHLDKGDEDWCFARADYCFKAAIETGSIKVRKSRQLDFKDFLEKGNE